MKEAPFFCESHNEYVVRRKGKGASEGLMSAKNHQLLWGKGVRMDLGANRSVWLTWVV